jgi:hypothetical protein
LPLNWKFPAKIGPKYRGQVNSTDDVQFFPTFELPAPNLAELEMAERKQVNEKEPQ